jgi:competence protein ComEC
LELDHAGDAPGVLQATSLAALFWNGRTDVPLYAKIAAAARVQGVPLVPLQPGDILHAGAMRIRVLWPNQAYRTSANQNDGSLVLRAELPGFTALVTGDLPVEAERWLPKALVDVDVLKVGHHGSKGSSGDAFLRAVSSEIALISVGAKNHYGHPTPEALVRLSAVHAAVYRTDQQGSLSVYRRAGRLVVVPERARQSGP